MKRQQQGPRSERADLAIEQALWQAGYARIAGLDEAGRGAWAGPLVAAAVILPGDPTILSALLGQVDDSKRLSPHGRERVYELLRAHDVPAGVGLVEAGEIDRIGIAAANRKAMALALSHLPVQPDCLLLDFLTLPDIPLPQRGLPHGDALSLSIAAASIVAKVTRDRWMCEQEQHYPGYGFARHKGYGTAEHRAALAELGPCALHRVSYRPVAVLARCSSDAGEGSDPRALVRPGKSWQVVEES